MSSAYASAVGFWVALICALAVAKDGHIHTAHHRYVAVERTDGLGAQLHTRATCMMEAALSRDVTYIHNPFPEHISHSVDGIAAERLFNLGEGYTPLATALSSVTVTSAKGCVCFSDLNSQAWPLLSTALLAKYNSPLATPKPRRYPLYRNDAVNVAVHLRRGDVEDCSEESRDGMKQHAETESAGVIDLLVDPCRVPRERCVSINHTVNTVTDVVAMISSMSLMRVNVVVFTEAVDGQHKHFVRDEFRRALPAQDISVVIGGDVFESFHAMVLSDVFVMGHSSFSFMPALYKRSDQVVVYDHFWSSPAPNWMVTRTHGHISKKAGPPVWWQVAAWRQMLQKVEAKAFASKVL